MVLLVGWYVSNKSHVMELANALKAHNIKHYLSSRNEVIDIDFRKYSMPVMLELGISSPTNLQYIAKNIRLVNSNPIEYK